jgi:hypothetical protein
VERSCFALLLALVALAAWEPAVVHAVAVIPGYTGACTADDNPHASVVAADRDRLPAGPFVIQLSPDDPPAGAPRERTQVDTDLTVPGAVMG